MLLAVPLGGEAFPTNVALNRFLLLSATTLCSKIVGEGGGGSTASRIPAITTAAI